jgi:prepilin-type N-terminal cleavage/methylation domain-containing protein
VPAKQRRQRGFTMIEIAVVVAIVAVMVALGYPLLRRARPRAELAGLGTQLHALVHRARQEALARGKDVAVIFYPAAATGSGVGRILVIADDTHGFMAGTAPAGNLDYCTSTPAVHGGETLTDLELPSGVTLTAPARTDPFPFPYNLVPAPTGGCSFCTGTVPGGGARGALRFDSRGRATFFADCGLPPLDLPNGGSVALTNTGLSGSRVLTVLPSGGIRTFSVE